jgi:cadmium resistance protein CadD (predicted permease)
LPSVLTGRAVLHLPPIEESFNYRFGQRNRVHVLGAVPLLLDLRVCTQELWRYLIVFIAAMAGAMLYLFGAGGTFSRIKPITNVTHKYSELLMSCVVILVNGRQVFWLGLITGRARP